VIYLKSRILAHRGVHSRNIQKNSIEALRIASDEGFGVETDIRDSFGGICISHDPPNSHDVLQFATLIELSFQGLVGLNVKSDGLISLSPSEGRIFSPSWKYFYFDFSFPERMQYKAKNLPIADRFSDLEELPRDSTSEYIWVDCFKDDLSGIQNALETYLDNGLTCILVSPELHGRDPLPIWNSTKSLFEKYENLHICTDLPYKFLSGKLCDD
jgi:hypothetical protein